MRCELAMCVNVATQGSSYRNTIRSWMNASVENTITRLVMRGINVSQAVLREAAIFQDTIFLRANASLQKYEGALLGTLLWYECATMAWPAAHFIGKAEDDLWLCLPDVYGSLLDASDTLARSGPTRGHSIYWGVQETYHLEIKSQVPLGFNHEWSVRQPCRQPEDKEGFLHGGFAGPFPFMKGPVYFLSTSLAARLVSNASWTPRVRALKAARTNRKVYEDAWTGYALSQLDPAPRIALVNVGRGGATFDELPKAAITNWSSERADSNAKDWTADSCSLARGPPVDPDCSVQPTIIVSRTVIWHNKGPWASRVRSAHNWKLLNHCSRERPALVVCDQFGTSCTGGSWIACTEVVHWNNCKRAMTRLAAPEQAAFVAAAQKDYTNWAAAMQIESYAPY